MRPANAVDAKVCENLLAEAARVHQSADLIVVRGENLQANLHSRFLQVSPECLLLEVPTHNSNPMLLQPGQFVEVYFRRDHERFGFDSRVVGYSQVELASDCIVQAVSIAPPHFLEYRQRRKCYRVSVATLPVVEAQLWPAEAVVEQTEPIEARLCNLSAGGVAVVVDRQRWQFTCDHRYRVQFTLPGGEGPFEFEAAVCHVRHVFQSRRQIIGLAFIPGPDPMDHRRLIDQIAQFVASHQREELFRARMGIEPTTV